MKTLNVKSGKVEKWETVNLLVDNSHFPIEKVGKKFGSYGKTSYLCSVRTSVLAIRVESRERQDLIDTASEQDITDTTPFWNHPAKGGFYCSYAFLDITDTTPFWNHPAKGGFYCSYAFLKNANLYTVFRSYTRNTSFFARMKCHPYLCIH